MSGEELLRRQAAAIARAANSRAENEDGLLCDDRRYQVRNKLHGIAPVAIEKDHDVRVFAYGSDARLDRAPVTATWFDNDAGACSGCFLDGSIPRAAIHYDNFAHILRKHRGHDPCNGRFLVETWNDRRDYGRPVADGPGCAAFVRDGAHRLQRKPQLAQASDGLSDSRALRNSR